MEFVVLHTNCFHLFFPTDGNANMYLYKTSNPLARKLVVVYLKAPFLVHYYLRCIINDINSSMSDCAKLFADDTCLILQDSTLNHLYKEVSYEISSVNEWMVAN